MAGNTNSIQDTSALDQREAQNAQMSNQHSLVGVKGFGPNGMVARFETFVISGVNGQTAEIEQVVIETLEDVATKAFNEGGGTMTEIEMDFYPELEARLEEGALAGKFELPPEEDRVDAFMALGGNFSLSFETDDPKPEPKHQQIAENTTNLDSIEPSSGPEPFAGSMAFQMGSMR